MAEHAQHMTSLTQTLLIVVRDDHRLFIDAFGNDEIAGVHSTRRS